MRNFNPNSFQPILNFPQRTEIDKTLFNEIDKLISESENLESYWSKELLLNVKNKDVKKFYHMSRMVKCSILGFKQEFKKNKGTKNNPIILERNVDFFKVVDNFWCDLTTLTNKKMKDEFYSTKEVEDNFDNFKNVSREFIKIGRKEDIRNISTDIVSKVKSNFEIATEEF